MQQDLEEAGRNVRYLADAAKRISSSTETISPSQTASVCVRALDSLHFILGYRSSSFQVQVEI